MKRILAIALLGLSGAFAQTTQTTPNLITSGTAHTWSGVTTGTIPTGCATAGPCPGGPAPIYDPSTNTISFSYNSNAYVGQVIAVNQALANTGAGVQVNGYNYSYDVRNMNGDNRQSGTDTFTVATALRGPNNSVLLSSNQYFNTKFEWTTYSGTKTATSPYDLANVTYMQIGITGGDNGFWGGYFGPQVRNVSMSLNYSVNPCATNPLYSTTCPGYQAEMDRLAAIEAARLAAIEAARIEAARIAAEQEAARLAAIEAARIEAERQAFLQSCSNNPLYSVNCPGYQDAYNKKIALETVSKQTATTQSTVVIATESTAAVTSNPAAAAISDPVVSAAVSTPTTTSATSPTSVTSVISAPAATTSTAAQAATTPVSAPAPTAQTKAEAKKTEGAVARAAARGNAATAAKEAVTSAANATSMEAQVATQSLVVGLMGYVPGFSAYQNSIVPDTMAAAVSRQYHKPTVDNRNAQRRLTGASDARWQEIVDSQYTIGK